MGAYRAEQVAVTQTLFRDVNEHVKAKHESFVTGRDPVRFVCECGDDRCTAGVELTLAEYERVRARPTWFVVAPLHEAVQFERVVTANDRFVIVEKHAGRTAALAELRDPRAKRIAARPATPS